MKGTIGEVLVKVVAVIFVAAILLIIIFMGIIPALEEDARFKGIPDLDHYVTDEEYVLSDEEYSAIENNCVYVDEQTSCEMAVLIVNDTGDRDINDFALRTLQKNGIGKEGKDNGVLIVLVISTREWKVEVGYGLTYVLTTAYISDVARNNVTLYLQAGEYGDAMIDMTYYLGIKIIKDYTEAEGGDPAYPIGGIPLTTTEWVIIIIILVALTVITKGRIWFILIFLLTGGKGGGGFGGGRSGGGGSRGRF
ncbi:MAG: TPM domain-containing protein [Methanomassiliicoccales archaeon]|nr:TPM domain-containing protein [Methanomassiliicoccales archaeon]